LTGKGHRALGRVDLNPRGYLSEGEDIREERCEATRRPSAPKVYVHNQKGGKTGEKELLMRGLPDRCPKSQRATTT